MYCSTSTGESEPASVMTVTWTLVMSGTASIGSTIALTRPGDRHQHRTGDHQEPIGEAELNQAFQHSIPFVLAGQQEFALEFEDAGDGDFIARLQVPT